jgi:hypothetical protein
MRTAPRCLALVLSASIASLTSGCGSGSASKVPPPPQPPDVYVAGYETNSSNLEIAKYWKNRTPVVLGAGTYSSLATSVAVSGANVYVAGREGSATHDFAKYWLNGEAVPLSDGTGDGYASSIFVDGSDVYVAGTNSLESGIATYWKNGVAVSLTDGTNPAFAWSIFVSGSDVYVAGYEYQTTQTGPNQYVVNPVAKYWLNGVPTDLNNGLALGIAYGIFVSGTDVYVAGDLCQTISAGCDTAPYWLNGTAVALTTQTQTAADSIVASGSDVYVVGNDGHTGVDFADLWQNGNLTQLSTSPSATNQVVVSGSDVYVAGAGTNQANQEVAGYWLNGNFVALTDGTNFATGFGIAVVPQQDPQ